MPILNIQKPFIRVCTEIDIPTILEFIHKKAIFDENISGTKSVILANNDIILLTMFGERPFAQCIFAMVGDVPVGFALYYFRFSSFKGRPNLWLDDLYVNEESRSRGAGALLMSQLSTIAMSNNCTHLGWSANTNNHRGIKFYEGLGANITEQKNTHLTFQLDEQFFIRLSEANN